MLVSVWPDSYNILFSPSTVGWVFHLFKFTPNFPDRIIWYIRIRIYYSGFTFMNLCFSSVFHNDTCFTTYTILTSFGVTYVYLLLFRILILKILNLCFSIEYVYFILFYCLLNLCTNVFNSHYIKVKKTHTG